jgi:Spy/CpxP family protein refolding chaperone
MSAKVALSAALAALGITGSTAFAQAPQPAQPPQPPAVSPGYGPGMGPGMMRGPSGQRRDDDDWGYGWGHGMRGGWGGGPGMMGGMAMAMGLGPINRLELNDTQRQEVRKIEDELRRTNWDLMGKMLDEMSRLRDAMWAAKRDRTAILAAHKRMSDLRQQMLENALTAYDKAEALLTPQQREQLRRYAW